MVDPHTRRCHQQGPAVEPDDQDGYYCTRPADHPGVHAAELAGQVLDTWPRTEDVTNP